MLQRFPDEISPNLLTEFGEIWQAGCGDSLSDATSRLVRKMKLNSSSQFWKLRVQHLPCSLEQQFTSPSRGTATQDQDVPNAVKVGILCQGVAEISSHALPDLDRPFVPGFQVFLHKFQFVSICK